MSGNPFENAPAGERSDAIAQLHAAECAIRRTLVQLIAAHDRDESWRTDGANSMATWLTAQLGVAHASAAQMVSAGRGVDSLPAISRTFGEGRLSWDKVRSLARFATPKSDQALAEDAQELSASQVHTLARRAHASPDDEATRVNRSLRVWWDRDRQWLRIHGRIAAADGAVVEKALERASLHIPRDAGSDLYQPHDQRLADALVEIAGAQLGSDADPDRASVVMHVDLEALAHGDGIADLETGSMVTAETARRIACDARLQIVLDGSDGAPVGVGRTSRTIPGWLNRLIRRRDQGCRFPGCESSFRAHAHHLVHWADGGPTDLDNLVTLCPYHHRLVHDDGWRIEGSLNGNLIFLRPDGRPYQPRPETLRSQVQARLVEPVLRPIAADSS